ncbi:MAG: hypothetical protein KC776_20620, partial [Myxococcales bacterium]|nr:hypothetical protein [Myxococcales bacterium]
MRTSRIVLGAGLALIGCGSSSKDNGAAGGTAGAAATSGAGGAAGSGGNTVDCTAGPCQCDTSPTCTLDCGTSGCSQAECLGGACQADCTGGNCNLDCSDGAQCNFDC